MSFVQAGNNVIAQALQIGSTIEDNKPRYDQFGKQAVRDRAALEIAQMDEIGRARQVGINVAANDKLADIDRDTDKFLRNERRKRRMAGKLAAGAGILGVYALSGKEEDEGPDERIEMLRGYINQNNQEIRDMQKDYESMTTEAPTQTVTEQDAGTQENTNPFKPSNNQTSSSNQPTGVRLAKDLISKGYSPQAAAAIAGNAKYESADFKAYEEREKNSYGTKGVGYLQWTNAGGGKRRSEFESWAKANNIDPRSYEASAGYIDAELADGRHWTGGANTKAFKGSSDLTQATRSFMNNYLRPNPQYANFDQRLKNAQSIFSQL